MPLPICIFYPKIDGRSLVTASFDKIVRLWDLARVPGFPIELESSPAAARNASKEWLAKILSVSVRLQLEMLRDYLAATTP